MSGNATSYGMSMFDCLRNCQATFQSSYTTYIPPAVYEVSNCFTSSPTLDIVCLFDSNYPCRYGLVSHCGFDLQFLDD